MDGRRGECGWRGCDRHGRLERTHAVDRHVLELVGHHVHERSEALEGLGVVVGPEHRGTDLCRWRVGRRIECRALDPQLLTRLHEHATQLAPADDADAHQAQPEGSGLSSTDLV